ncbi:MAG: hypothetical protein ACI909_000504 [Planctomycetota bacterium]|jgi:hypothetical protein
MSWIPKMTPTTLTTILNSAPMVIQGASKLIKLIKEQGKPKPEDGVESQLTLDSLNADVKHLKTRLAATDESNIEQIKLIEQLAKQNETLAASLSKSYSRLNLLTIITILAVLLSFASLIVVLLR